MTYFRSAELQDLDALNDLLYRSKKHWGYDKKFMDHRFLDIFNKNVNKDNNY